MSKRLILYDPHRPFGPVCCLCDTRRAETDEDEICQQCWDEGIAKANQVRLERIASGWTVDSTGGIHPPTGAKE